MSYQSIYKALVKEAGMRKEALTPKGKLLEGAQNLLKLTVKPTGRDLFRSGLKGKIGKDPLQLLGNKLRLRSIQRSNPRYWNSRTPIDHGIKDLISRAEIADAYAPYRAIIDGRYGWDLMRNGRTRFNNLLKPLENTRFGDKATRILKRLDRRVDIQDSEDIRNIVTALRSHLVQNGNEQRSRAAMKEALRAIGGTQNLQKGLSYLLKKISIK